ncbi:MAG: DUF4982 domain-containing protein [Treponema sp.]|nr:DUF4982 domain-containing protein [Treponema sp.]
MALPPGRWYSYQAEVELFLNRKSLGRKPAGKANRYKARFDQVYEPETLRAESLNNNREVSDMEIRTVGRQERRSIAAVVACLAAWHGERAARSHGHAVAVVAHALPPRMSNTPPEFTITPSPFPPGPL